MSKINISNLPTVCGRYVENEELAPFTTLKVGGAADVSFYPADLEDLQGFLKAKGASIPVTALGEGSNALISDKGIRGVVLRLNEGVNDVQVNGTEIFAQAGATNGKVARAAREHELTGVEFLCGIPGSIGGALKMNAGAYGQETVDSLKDVHVVTADGDYKVMNPSEFNFSYRKSHLPEGWFYVGATFSLEKGDKTKIRDRMREINRNRATSQPLNMPSSGSWFKNPTLENGEKVNAWKVVDDAGCRGWQLGGAQVSEKHTNFFVNAGGATSAELIQLTEKVEKEIEEKLGVKMVREVRVLGEK